MTLQYIGRLDKEKLGKYKKLIITDKVLISEERIIHMKEHHPELTDNEITYVSEKIKKPDYIFDDRKNIDTILMVKDNNNKNYITVVKINTNICFKEKSNTVISFWNISNKKLRQFIRNEQIIYKRLDNEE